MHDIVLLGAPVGGAAVLTQLLRSLPADIRASIFVVLHSEPDRPILLADVLNAPGRMRATEAIDGEPIEHNRIYIACDDKHLVLEPDRIRLTSDAEENDRRPSIDVLFRSAAIAHKERVVGVILVHAREDGLIGLNAVRLGGGRTMTHRNELMQDKPRHPETGEELAHDHLELSEIGPRLLAYVQGTNGNGPATPASQAYAKRCKRRLFSPETNKSGKNPARRTHDKGL
jgi:two-component system, chemotaxis family, protein-glutamate methylesterase/glutaminase